MPYQDLTPVPYAILTRPQSELTRRTMGNITLRTAYATRSLEEKWHHTAARAYASYGARQISRCFSFVWKHHPKIPILDCEYKQVLQISQVSLFTYGSSMATPAYAQLTHGLRVPYAKKRYHFNEGRTEKKNMPFILLLSIIEIEIAFIHISLTQLTRKHTPQFCLRILTRLKVLLTQPFDMSNPFRKQSTGVLNAAHIVWP